MVKSIFPKFSGESEIPRREIFSRPGTRILVVPVNQALYSSPFATRSGKNRTLGSRTYPRTGPDAFFRTDPKIVGNPFPPGGGDQGIRKTNPQRPKRSSPRREGFGFCAKQILERSPTFPRKVFCGHQTGQHRSKLGF